MNSLIILLITVTTCAGLYIKDDSVDPSSGKGIQKDDKYTRPKFNNLESFSNPIVEQQSEHLVRSTRSIKNSPVYNNLEVIFDSHKSNWNHRWVVNDSRREGLTMSRKVQFNKNADLVTIFNSKVEGWNHPWVVYDSRSGSDSKRSSYKGKKIY